MKRLMTLSLLVILCAATHASPAADGDATPRQRIAYATFLGGPEWDQAREVIVSRDGSVLIGAQTNSETMPVTPGALHPKYAGDDPHLGHGGVYGGDCYLARLSPDGSRVLAATYFGGSKQERNTYGMALDSRGNVVIATATRSPDLSTTAGCFQPKFGGGQSDMTVAKLAPDLQGLIWCTYVGGSRDDSPRGGLTLDEQDCVYVVGTSNSPNFPTTPGVFQPQLNGPRDSTIVKLKADGSGLVFGTLLGGSGEEMVRSIAFGPEGSIYLVGHTSSPDFPVTPAAVQSKFGGGSGDAFVVKLMRQ